MFPGLASPQLYAPVLFWAAAISLELVLTGFLVGAARKRTGIPYPCMTGTSEYAVAAVEKKRKKKPTQEEWLDFANAQRAHGNFVEGVATILCSLLISGLFYPSASASLGALYFFGRVLYAWGYVSSGAKGRLPGVILIDIALLGTCGTALYGSAVAAGWI